MAYRNNVLELVVDRLYFLFGLLCLALADIEGYVAILLRSDLS